MIFEHTICKLAEAEYNLLTSKVKDVKFGYFVQRVLIVILFWCCINHLVTNQLVLYCQALRTGRTMETYDEARQLSAKQRAAMPSKKYPSNDNIYSYRFIFYGVLNIL